MKGNFVKRCLFLLFATNMIVATPVFADGIYVTKDLKHAQGDHTVIALNEKQIKDVERSRVVVLTDKQLKPLKALYEKTPRKLVVLSSRWEICTCDIEVYGIWCRVGELDVPHSELKAQEQMDKYLEENPSEKDDWDNSSPDEGERKNDEYAYVGEEIILDSKGDMYLDGKRISEEGLRKMINEISSSEVRAKEVYRYISFDLPPPISEEVDKRIYDLLQRTNAYCKERKVELSAMGIKLD